MTPQQKLRWAVLAVEAGWAKLPAPEYPCPNVDELYEREDACHGDAKEEVRQGKEKTGLRTEYSRHYESRGVAMQMPDGSWVGWTYWYGGGKHGEPEAVDWMGYAYDVDFHEEEKLVVVRTFSRSGG